MHDSYLEALKEALAHAPNDQVRETLQALIDGHVTTQGGSGDNGPPPPTP